MHLIGSAQAQASPIEFLRQVRAGRPLTAEIGGTHWVNGLNEAQLRARAGLARGALPALWDTASAAALTARGKMPAPLRALPLLPLGQALGTGLGWKPIGYLFDIGFTRERLDAPRRPRPGHRATLTLTAEHDGRIVADIAAEWATLHTEPFTLHLTEPAGGTYRRGAAGEVVDMDAVEFCRTLSGRSPRTTDSVLRHALPL